MKLKLSICGQSICLLNWQELREKSEAWGDIFDVRKMSEFTCSGTGVQLDWNWVHTRLQNKESESPSSFKLRLKVTMIMTNQIPPFTVSQRPRNLNLTGQILLNKSELAMLIKHCCKFRRLWTKQNKKDFWNSNTNLNLNRE